MPIDDSRLQRLCTALQGISEQQFATIERIVEQFNREFIASLRAPASDIIDDSVLRDFGDVLRIHHCFSHAPLMKERFEYAFLETMRMGGRVAQLADSRTNRGHDLTVDGVRFSLKTQADKNIREDEIHISKFMELGKGSWASRSTDLDGLREQFMRHLDSYDRILTLRSLSRKAAATWKYELVEIPRTLLEEAANGALRVCRESAQSPKPGYCDVIDENGALKFQLYFDGGTERKLQIKHLRKALCLVHASWEFAAE